MSYASPIHTRLAADSTLTALLTGGVYLFESIGYEINRDTLAAAFNSLLLRPCLVIKGRGNIPTPFIRDANTQFTSTRQVVELYLYDDPAAGWTTLHSAANRIYALLHEQPLIGAYQVTLTNEIDGEREPGLGDAPMFRVDYEIIGRRFI